MPVYIQSANQISAQKPLSDEWFDHPVYYDDKRVPTIDPDFTGHFPPLAARRMCVLLKRAVMMSRLTLRAAATEMPDAIISGTGLGCIENTEKFLHSIMENDEQFLQPTSFMQSTHNVLSSTVAIDLKCHGYNNTFVHRGASFENALFDAFMQFEQKRIRTALVGGYDELTDDYYRFFERIGIWDFVRGTSPAERCFAGEAAVSMLLGMEKNEHTICEINDVALLFRPTYEQLGATLDAMLTKAGCAGGLSSSSSSGGMDAVLTGLNTHVENDRVYREVTARFFGDCPIMQYKHLFGESFSSSALGVYVATICLRNGCIPSFLLADTPRRRGAASGISGVKRILVYNHHRNKSHSFILLSSCSN